LPSDIAKGCKQDIVLYRRSTMQKKADEDLARRTLDSELDKELESTFPASDALKITRRRSSSSARQKHDSKNEH
jgi:hypothetical protein